MYSIIGYENIYIHTYLTTLINYTTPLKFKNKPYSVYF